MFSTAIKSFFLIVAIVAGTAFSQDQNVRQAPEVCTEIAVSADARLHSMAYAIGVQIYRWNGTSWAFVAPEANLYADPNYRGKIGTHYGGPTWESNSGSKVVARRVDGCTPDPTAIAWLLLEAVESNGPGIYNGVTQIQRVNTVGGVAPQLPGQFVGQEARIPYTTEYYFYR